MSVQAQSKVIKGFKLSDGEFDFFRTKIFDFCGIVLGPEKRILVESRLSKILLKYNYKNFAQFCQLLKSQPMDSSDWQMTINLLTTHTTEWFRELDHFEYLEKTWLPKWMAKNPNKKLRVWSVACSTGEEPYSIALLLYPFKQKNGLDFEIYATDIDTQVLQKAKKGLYKIEGLKKIPQKLWKDTLAKGQNKMAAYFKVRESLAKAVQFERLNLNQAQYPEQGKFDLILCRNVFIYFDLQVIGRVANILYQKAEPGALLLTGHSESFADQKVPWNFESPSIYFKPEKTEFPLSKNKSKTKVLIVDDAIVIRQMLKKILSADPEIEVVAEAESAAQAEKVLSEFEVDCMTLDIHMPIEDGVSFLGRIIQKKFIPTILVTSASMSDGEIVFEGLQKGAVDYVQKPALEDLAEVGSLICEKIKIASRVTENPRPKLSVKPPLNQGSVLRRDFCMIAIGASTGGVQALTEILCALPKEIPPIVIVQHIPPVFSKAFAERLDRICPFEVLEAKNGDIILPNRVLIAPGGSQLSVVQKSGRFEVSVFDGPRVNRHKPSVDVLFESVAKDVGADALGVLLTGMGEDGAKGLLSMYKKGASTLAQDQSTCVVFGMPAAAIKLGGVSKVMSLSQIASFLGQTRYLNSNPKNESGNQSIAQSRNKKS